MFVFFILVFAFVLSFFENLILWLIVLWVIDLIFLILLFIDFFYKKKSIKMYFLYILYSFLAFGLIFFWMSYKQYSFKKFINYWNNLGVITKSQPFPQWNMFMGTWVVIEKYSDWKYVFEDWYKNKYYLYSKKNFFWWDIVFITANFKKWYLDFSEIYDIKKQVKNFKLLKKSFFNKLSLTSWWFMKYEFDYPKWLFMKGYYWTLYEKNSKVLWYKKMWFISNIRKKLKDKFIKYYWKNKVSWLILWMLIWDRSEIPKSDYKVFINSSLVHIIAVSGGNILMIVVFLWFSLFFLPFYLRNAVILLVIVWYSFLCGMDSSVFRAMIMWGLSLLALFRWKEIDIRRSMKYAFVFMLIINPYFLIYDVGFLLSFFALLWLVILDFFWKEKKEKNIEVNIKNNNEKQQKSIQNKLFHKVFSEYIQPSIGATIWIFPIIMFFMGKLNIIWLLANLFVLPIVPFVMIYGFISVFLYQWLWYSFLLWIEKILSLYIYNVSDFVANYWVYLTIDWAIEKYLILVLWILLLFLLRKKMIKIIDEKTV